MNINIGINPVIFKLGMFEMRWYSLAIITAIGVAVWFVGREFRRKGIDDTNFGNIAIWAIASGIIGARLFHLFDEVDYYLANPRMIFNFQEGGLAIYGAVVGGFIGVVIGTRLHKTPFLKTIDAIAPGLVLGQAIGRFGCIVNGDAWGAAASSNAPLTFTYTNPDSFIPNRLIGVPTHPYPIYDMALNLIVFAVLMRLRVRKPALPDGALFAIFVALYGVGRFIVSYVREEKVWFFGLQQAQVIAVIMVAAGVLALAWLTRRRDERRGMPAGMPA